VPTHVALLRGINVGGKNLLPMQHLAGIFQDAGCDEVRTYIQSGNVIFKASRASCGKLPALIAGGIADRFGYRTPVLLRSVEDLAETIRHNPFLQAGAPENWLHVLFLESDAPAFREAIRARN
jgi:uncharacterized protein (DUF1697 family)